MGFRITLKNFEIKKVIICYILFLNWFKSDWSIFKSDSIDNKYVFISYNCQLNTYAIQRKVDFIFLKKKTSFFWKKKTSFFWKKKLLFFQKLFQSNNIAYSFRTPKSSRTFTHRYSSKREVFTKQETMICRNSREIG